jgi:hypothetical protein
VASNKECPRCGGVNGDFVRGVCRTCYMRDDHQRRFASPATDQQRITVIHDIYGRRLCVECHEPGTYARGLCAKCYMQNYRRRHRMKVCICASCGVSFQSSHRDALYCSRSCRRRARSTHRPLLGGPNLPRLDVRPIVQSVIDAVESGELLANGALIRDAENQLRVRPSVLIPGDGPKQIVRGRRERFRSAMERAMNALGWELIALIPALKFKKSGPKTDVSP